MKNSVFTFENDDVAQAVIGQCDANLLFLEKYLKADFFARGNEIHLKGSEADVAVATKVFQHLLALASAKIDINETVLGYAIAAAKKNEENVADALTETIYTTARGKQIKARTLGQYHYWQDMKHHDVTFGVGPAGTGKTYLAVVMAVIALKSRAVRRIVLTRPAVEAGEKLGFLPGDLQEKVDPYLRPLYDGLFDVLGMETAQKMLEKGIIEVAPLAYMRGRTLDDAFIILDEAQNTTIPQMKMFLTRIGFGSKAVITGDVTQVDLGRDQTSGLVNAQNVLKDVEGVAFAYFSAEDVVRHPLVQAIINAYEKEK